MKKKQSTDTILERIWEGIFNNDLNLVVRIIDHDGYEFIQLALLETTGNLRQSYLMNLPTTSICITALQKAYRRLQNRQTTRASN